MLVSSSLSYDGLDAVPSYGYSCDNIGNRKTAQELAKNSPTQPTARRASPAETERPSWNAATTARNEGT